MSDSRSIYLDYAAATPLDERVQAAMSPFLSDRFYNPSATYAPARAVKASLQKAREGVAHYLGSRSTDITFTAGGTEANNLAIHGIMREFPDGSLVVSAIEHDSVLEPAQHYPHTLLPVDKDGRVDPKALEQYITDQTVLVSVMYANNEVGTVQPIKELASVIEKVKAERRRLGNSRPLYFHTDACQASNYLDLHVARLGVDLMTLNGGKLYGPKQSGALYIKSGISLQPVIEGGGQERNLRSGTENVAGSIGFSVALGIAQDMRNTEAKRLSELQQYFFMQLAKILPRAGINGSKRFRLPNNIHITFPGTDNERLLMQLDSAAIYAAAGSACSASNEESSHVLKAMGRSDEQARSSLRITIGRQTSKKDVDIVIHALKQLVAR